MHLITGKKGTPHITSENQGFINSEIFGADNYVFEFSKNFQAVKLDDNHVQIKDGQGIMNGRHFEIETDTTEQVTIESGTIGYSRNDLIVARYTKNESGIENVSLEVVKGTASQTIPSDPEYNEGNILEGDVLVDFPLYRVKINDLAIQEIVPLFDIIEVNISEIGKGLQALEDEVQELIDSQVVDKDYVPTLYSGSTEPPLYIRDLVPSGTYPKIGDLYVKKDGPELLGIYVLEEINGYEVDTRLFWKKLAYNSDVEMKPNVFIGTDRPFNLPTTEEQEKVKQGDLFFKIVQETIHELRAMYVCSEVIRYSGEIQDILWEEIPLLENVYTKTETNNLLTTKLNRDDGIKLLYGTTDPSQNVLDGSKTGDIYIRLNGGNDRNMSQVVGMWIVSVYPSSGNYYWQEIPLGDYYNKTETDNLLNAKQDTLTEGNNIEIDANNVISYQESEWELLKTVEATEDNPLSEIVWQASDLDNGTYDDIMVKATNVQGNTVGNYGMQCKTTANKFNAGLFGALLSSAVSTTVSRNFFTTIERLNGTTEFDISSWYVDNYLNKEIRVIQTAPDLVVDNPSHKLYYVRFYFSSTNTIKSGTFKIYGRKRIYGTTAQTLNSPLNLNREEINLDGTLPDELEGGFLKNVETDVLDTELNEIDESEVKKEVSETEKKTEIEEPETEKESEIDNSEIEK